MPIVGVEGKKPNDNFIDQLKMNAEAAINHLSNLELEIKIELLWADIVMVHL